MKQYKGTFIGERALYDIHDAEIFDSIFEKGESPLKECSNLSLRDVEFRWKYPLWYGDNIKCIRTTFLEMSRSGIWYTSNISIIDSEIHAPKLFRRCEKVTLINCQLDHALETLWGSKDINLINIKAKGDYFALNAENIKVSEFYLDGNYAFDGAKNIEINNATMNSKDSFWNTENVVVRNSKIVGEYLGWNSRNLTFINCDISSHQGFCYIKGLKLINCRIYHTDLCFEFCEDLDVEVTTYVDSIKNPISGKIKVKDVGTLILDEKYVDRNKIKVYVDKK